MCGIGGELRIDGGNPDLVLMQRMLGRLARRGPDYSGVWSDGPLLLGHCRLSIIDISERSNQPFLDSDLGFAIAFNGTIYNYRELRCNLVSKGYTFSSEGDTEVILKAYAEWGERCVENLIGVFAFAIWDMRNHSLFLARDRLGIKPLYYTENKHSFYFASNTQALLEVAGTDTTIDAVALHYQLTLHAVIPAPHTILNGIRKLAPATTLTINFNGIKRTRVYWQLTTFQSEFRTEEEWVMAIHDTLRLAVKRRLEAADVPVGLLLSGGLDSSLLVALFAEYGCKDLITFSIGFEDQPEEKGSEFEYSDLVVDRYRTRHNKYLVSNDYLLERLPETISCMSEPMVGQDAAAFFLLSEYASKVVRVVQSGQGADEVFGGYFWYPLMSAATGSDLDRFRSHYFDRDHTEWLETVATSYHGPDHTSKFIAEHLKQDTFNYIDKVLHLDVTTLVVDDPVKRVDNMTMAWGLEARVPFLDHELVELAMQLPPDLKSSKYVLKKIARELLPKEIINRSKGYFPVPVLKFVRGRFLDFMCDIVNSQACRARGLFQQAYLDKLIAAPEVHMTRLMGSKLWHVALLELWMQINVDPVN
jgi:asparagine synthase (glutamine-hydrolysing)